MHNEAKKKILITGGSGFVGQNIVALLKNYSEYEIYNLGLNPIDNAPNINNIRHDAMNTDLSNIADDFDIIIHLLALSNEKYCSDFDRAETINVEFTKAILRLAERQKKLDKMIYLSSIIIYDNNNVSPVKENDKLYLNYTTYSFTKGVAEAYVNYYLEQRNLPIIIFRLSNIYGPFQDVVDSPFLVPSKIKEGLEKHKITVFNLEPKRDWIYSRDAAEAIVASLEHANMTGIFNLASGKGSSVEDVVGEIARQLDVPYDSLNKPTTGPDNFYCDITKIKTALKWMPKTPFHVGIKNTIDYINNL